MRILLSNDDGYFAPGLAVLAATLSRQGHEVTVVAPERDRSGASNSLTLDRPLMVRKTPAGFHYVNGTPTDCVHLAVTGLLPELPEMVISGINHGANMGDDTVYSGTVAAATEGFLLGIPSVAVSLANLQQEHFQAAADFVAGLAARFAADPVPEHVLLNVNVPDLPPDQIQAWKSPASAGVTRPRTPSRRSTRATRPCTGWAPRARPRMPAPARIFMPCPRAGFP
jgi:5'-nucleotidase